MKVKANIGASPFPWCSTELEINDEGQTDIRGQSIPPITVIVRSGASSLQTYTTREEMRKFAEGLLELCGVEADHA